MNIDHVDTISFAQAELPKIFLKKNKNKHLNQSESSNQVNKHKQ